MAEIIRRAKHPSAVEPRLSGGRPVRPDLPDLYPPLQVAASSLAAHEAALDPHSQYLTPAEADAAYSLLGHTHTFASLTSKPTTLAGYGIADAYTITAVDGLFTAHLAAMP